MDKLVHLVKLSVGSEGIEDLARWQKHPGSKGPDGMNRHVTRMWPKRGDEILNGGSIYWVIKGMIQCRQEIARLDEVIGADGIRRCGIVLRGPLVPVNPAPKRPFQGWRYLKPEDAPADMGERKAGDTPLPPELARELADMGLL